MSYTEVMEKLGGAKVLGSIGSEMDLMEAIRSGLPVRALDAMLDHLVTATVLQVEVFGLVGSARTLQRKRMQQRAATGKASGNRRTSRLKPVVLSPAESDNLARLARLVVRAEEVFGDNDKARRWLGTPNRVLGGTRPLSLLDNDVGALAVERVLGRIQYGVYS